MNTKRILAALLSALLLFSLSPAALAAAAETEAEEERIVVRRIATQADFLRFARSCAMDATAGSVVRPA